MLLCMPGLNIADQRRAAIDMLVVSDCSMRSCLSRAHCSRTPASEHWTYKGLQSQSREIAPTGQSVAGAKIGRFRGFYFLISGSNVPFCSLHHSFTIATYTYIH